MFRRLLIASVCTSVLGVVAPATASPSVTPTTSDRDVATVKKVVRQYGDGPVRLEKGQRLALRFRGERGDRVRLAAVYRHDGESSFASTRYTTVTLRGQRSTFRLGADGFFRLRGTGWFTLRYDRPSYHEIGVRRVQLLKQVAVTHDRRGSTRVPVRRGIQYAITVRAPRSGIDLVSVGQWGFGVVGNDYADYIEGESLVLAPGLPVYGSNPTFPLTQPLKPGQDVTVLANPATTGRVTTTEPRDAGTTRLDGPAIQLPGGGAGAVVTEVAAADLASSAQRLLNVRFVGATADHYRTTLVLPPGGGVAELAAPAYTAGGSWPAPLYRLVQTEGTYRVLVFSTFHEATAGSFELDSVADGGSIAVDGAPATVPVRTDGRYTLLGINQPEAYAPSYLSVTDVTVPGRWVVYAGRLTRVDCSGDTSLGCGDGNGTSLSEPGTQSTVLNGGFVLAMPTEDQTSGSFTVRLTKTYTP